MRWCSLVRTVAGSGARRAPMPLSPLPLPVCGAAADAAAASASVASFHASGALGCAARGVSSLSAAAAAARRHPAKSSSVAAVRAELDRLLQSLSTAAAAAAGAAGRKKGSRPSANLKKAATMAVKKRAEGATRAAKTSSRRKTHQKVKKVAAAPKRKIKKPNKSKKKREKALTRAAAKFSAPAPRSLHKTTTTTTKKTKKKIRPSAAVDRKKIWSRNAQKAKKAHQWRRSKLSNNAGTLLGSNSNNKKSSNINSKNKNNTNNAGHTSTSINSSTKKSRKQAADALIRAANAHLLIPSGYGNGRLQYSADKAGMAGVDVAKVQAIISAEAARNAAAADAADSADAAAAVDAAANAINNNSNNNNNKSHKKTTDDFTSLASATHRRTAEKASATPSLLALMRATDSSTKNGDQKKSNKNTAEGGKSTRAATKKRSGLARAPVVRVSTTNHANNATTTTSVDDNGIPRGPRGRFHRKEREKDVARGRRHAAVVARAAAFNRLPARSPVRVAARRAAAALTRRLEASRDLSRRYIHVDMDMYYAAVEERKNPALRDVPFAVGSKAMLTTSNYRARAYGVRSGMPGYVALKLCPQLVIVPPDFPAYRAAAAQIRALGARYDRSIVSVGLDEFTIDVTDYLARQRGRAKALGLRRKPPTAADVCRELRAAIAARTGLTASGGIAPTAAFAKLATGVNKPNGQYEEVLPTRGAVLARCRRMRVRDVPGIGPAQEALLGALGIRECRHLRQRAPLLCFLFPKAERTCEMLVGAGIGVMTTYADKVWATHGRLAAARRQPKSTGKSVTFPRRMTEGLASVEAVWPLLRPVAAHAFRQLRQSRSAARTVEFHMKNIFFDEFAARATVASGKNGKGVDDGMKLWAAVQRVAEPVLKEDGRYRNIRLLGVRFTNLVPSAKAGEKTTKKAIGGAVAARPKKKAVRKAPGGKASAARRARTNAAILQNRR